MKESRSASQVLYGFLPFQTVDLKSDVWRVSAWRNPIRVANVDDQTLRRELLRLVHPWESTHRDSHLARALHRNDPIAVYEVSPENGVDVEPFPRQWICRTCKRIHTKPDAKCQCGKPSFRSFHFVAYHPECGSMREVPLPPACASHNQRAVEFPGASASTELRFVCPICKIELRKGFPKIQCTCAKGGLFTYNVHRAASVYTPRTVVIVNAPLADHRQKIEQAGGRARALGWMLDGMQGLVTQASATEDSIRQGLAAQNLPESAIEAMLETIRKSGSLASSAAITLAPEVKDDAEDQATTVALASINSRRSIADLQTGAKSGSALEHLYQTEYPKAMADAGLESVDLLDKFPILTGAFGFTRGEHAPGATALVPFKVKNAIAVHASFVETEALFFRLDPIKVAQWLVARGRSLPAFSDRRSARLAVLELCRMPDSADRDGSIHQELFTLVHSYAHRMMRIGAKFAGVDRNSLAELLVPLHMGFFIYAGARGDFVLGGLQAVFESHLHTLLGAVVSDEHRCPMDPGCSKATGACVGCLHVGEPSCRWFNQLLNRETLFGINGYLKPQRAKGVAVGSTQ